MAKDKFLLISLKDAESKQLGQVITNDTSRKVLDYLAEQNATETQISQALAIPLPTIHYNLKALMKAGLVVSEEFHYSEKGKEVNHYRLANKYIIIAQGTTWGLKERLKSILPVIPVVGGVAWALELAASQWRLSQAIGAGSSSGQLLQEAIPQPMAMAKSAVAPTAAEAVPPAAPSLSSFDAGVQQPPLAGTTPMDVGSLSHPGLWLVAGALLAVGVWLLVEWIREKKR